MLPAHYQLLAQIGAGADGVAYRARDPRDGGLVEVRTLAAARADDARWQALRRQISLAALIDHPHAVYVEEAGLADDPPWVVLEWVENDWEAVRPNGKPLPASKAVFLLGQLADALGAAHRVGLVHGWLGPDNVRLDDQRIPRIDLTGAAVRMPREHGVSADAAYRAPELAAAAPDFAADVYSLGALFFALLTGHPLRSRAEAPGETPASRTSAVTVPQVPAAGTAINRLLAEMLAADPAERPTARQVEERLKDLLAVLATADGRSANLPDDNWITRLSAPLAATVETALAVQPRSAVAGRTHLGRFRLLGKLGEGGMGAVYKAEDPADGRLVALKVLSGQAADSAGALKRLHKEARLLAEVNNPYVANLLEVNEEDGIFYLAIEYVPGRSLDRYLVERGRLPEPEALAIAADVARALVEAHRRGIVHRDIKPENILLEKDEGRRMKDEQTVHAASSFILHPSSFRVRLTDFGLARHVVESESLNVTRAGTAVGTPLYMAPEQCRGGQLDARADVYSLGATLFHLLAGRPPFLADGPLAVMALHCNEPPPPLKKFCAGVSDGVCQVVEKALAKAPDARYTDAAALLRDVERLLRGEPTGIEVHPKLPPCDPERVLRYDWSWELEASPEQLWPHVSNTERLNRAVGLPAVQFTMQHDPDKGTQRFGTLRKAGITASWQEHPFEWVEARKFGVLREYSQGPFKWLVSLVELAPRAGGGTRLSHRVRLEPNGLLGRTAAAVEVGIKGRRAVERVYRRIDGGLTGKLGSHAAVDFFEEPAAVSADKRRRLEALLDTLSERQVEPAVLEKLGDFLLHAPAQEVARIRPRALARRLSLDADAVVAACLYGAREGLLVLLWDILCPICRIPSEVKDTLRLLKEHGRCEACDLDYELDFANSVELIFRAHPAVRDVEVGTYCIGGPIHAPHVVAQVRVAPAERVELELALTEGAYRLRGPQLPFALDLRVLPTATATRCELALTRGPDGTTARQLKPGGQVFALANDGKQELVVRVERTAPRDDALTAARASALALFRELFPGEVLTPGQLVSVATVTLLVTELDDARRLYETLGDAKAFAVVHEHFRLLDERIRQEGGALVKTVGEGVVAAFPEPVAAVRVGLDLPAVLAAGKETRGLRPRAAVHRGPAMVATLNDHLDYFGTTVQQATQLTRLARGGELVATDAVTADPPVAALLRSRGVEGELFTAELPGRPGCLIQRFNVSSHV